MTSESARSPATCTSYLKHKNRQSDFLAAHRQTRRSCVLDWTRRSPGSSLPEITAFQATRARMYVMRNLSRTAALQRVDNQYNELALRNHTLPGLYYITVMVISPTTVSVVYYVTNLKAFTSSPP